MTVCALGLDILEASYQQGMDLSIVSKDTRETLSLDHRNRYGEDTPIGNEASSGKSIRICHEGRQLEEIEYTVSST